MIYPTVKNKPTDQETKLKEICQSLNNAFLINSSDKNHIKEQMENIVKKEIFRRVVCDNNEINNEINNKIDNLMKENEIFPTLPLYEGFPTKNIWTALQSCNSYITWASAQVKNLINGSLPKNSIEDRSPIPRKTEKVWYSHRNRDGSKLYTDPPAGGISPHHDTSRRKQT